MLQTKVETGELDEDLVDEQHEEEFTHAEVAGNN